MIINKVKKKDFISQMHASSGNNCSDWIEPEDTKISHFKNGKCLPFELCLGGCCLSGFYGLFKCFFSNPLTRKIGCCGGRSCDNFNNFNNFNNNKCCCCCGCHTNPYKKCC